MKKLFYLGFAVLVVFSFLYGQREWIAKSSELVRMFTRVSDGIVYCHSDRSKTTGIVVKRTPKGSWVETAQHKVDRDFPQSSKIDVKMERTQAAKVYRATEIIVPEDRKLDLLLFFVPGLKTKHVFKKFRDPYRYEETWVFGFRGGADKVPGGGGFVTDYVVAPEFVFSSAATWYGNSGSPVLVRDGVCVGVAVRMANQSTDTLFVSGVAVKEFIDKALKGRK